VWNRGTPGQGPASGSSASDRIRDGHGRGGRLARSAAALIAGFAAVLATAGSPAAGAAPAPFDPSISMAFISQAQLVPARPTQLESITYDNQGGGQFVNVGDTSSGVRYNALAFNTDDDFLYAIVKEAIRTPTSPAGLAAGDLIRIGRGAAIARVGRVPGNPDGNTAAGANAGAYDPATHQYLVWRDNLGGASPQFTNLFAVSTSTGAATSICPLQTRSNAQDFTFRDGFLWGLARSGNAAVLVRVTPTPSGGSCPVASFPVPGVVLDANDGDQFGAAWTLADGDRVFSNNDSGRLVQLAVSNAGAITDVILRSGPANQSNDGASIVGSPVDLAVTKTPDSFGQVSGVATWTIEVANHGPSPASNWTMTDTLPAGMTFRAATIGGVDANCSGTTTVSCLVGSLAVGGTTTVTVSATAASPSVDCVTNSVSVEPDSQLDTNPANNTSTADPICRPGLVLTKTHTDPAGNPVTYTVTATNSGRGPLNAAVVDDDLSDVLDDAAFVGGSTACTNHGGATTTACEFDATGPGAPLVHWAGSLPPGATVDIAYQVSLTGGGNDLVKNIAYEPGDPANPVPPARCGPDGLGTDTGLPCAETEFLLLPDVTVGKSATPASGSEVATGDAITYTLTFRNAGLGRAAIDYTDDAGDVLDDAAVTSQPVASDPSWVVGALTPATAFRMQGDLPATSTVTVSYTVQVLPGPSRANGLLVNYLTPTGQAPPVECLPADPLCTTHPTANAPDIVASKHAAPGSGATITAGGTVTYTLTFRNLGLGPGTVDYVDHAAGVLDDGEVVSQPSASDPSWTVGRLSPETSFSVTGNLAAGATATVTYRVRVLPPAQRGDSLLLNFLDPAGVTPPSDCTAGDPLCTAHPIANTPPPAPPGPVSPPPGPFPVGGVQTGHAIPPAAGIGAAGLATLTAAVALLALLAARRRRALLTAAGVWLVVLESLPGWVWRRRLRWRLLALVAMGVAAGAAAVASIPVATGPPAATAAPYAARPAGANAAPLAPSGMRIRVPAIGVDAPVVSLDLNSDRTLQVPTDPADAGWWSGGTTPGQRGPAVIVGHVNWNGRPAVFAQLGRLRPGQAILVTHPGGETDRFLVTGTAVYPKAAFPTNLVYGPQPAPVLRLITCTGRFEAATGHYADNLVVFARLAPDMRPDQATDLAASRA
jgi:large repetitive protein